MYVSLLSSNTTFFQFVGSVCVWGVKICVQFCLNPLFFSMLWEWGTVWVLESTKNHANDPINLHVAPIAIYDKVSAKRTVQFHAQLVTKPLFSVMAENCAPVCHPPTPVMLLGNPQALETV